MYKNIVIVLSTYSCASLKKEVTSQYLFDTNMYKKILGKEVFEGSDRFELKPKARTNLTPSLYFNRNSNC